MQLASNSPVCFDYIFTSIKTISFIQSLHVQATCQIGHTSPAERMRPAQVVITKGDTLLI